MKNNITQGSPLFYGLGIAPKILDILERIKFKVPTPIQQKATPLAIEAEKPWGQTSKVESKVVGTIGSSPRKANIVSNFEA